MPGIKPAPHQILLGFQAAKFYDLFYSPNLSTYLCLLVDGAIRHLGKLTTLMNLTIG